MTETFSERAAHFSGLLDHATDRWDAPTPCEGWRVRDVVAHVIETERDFLDRQDLSLPVADHAAPPDQAFREHAAAVSAVLARDGVAERAYDGYFGPTTVGATMADFYGWDLLVHGWDVARATGQAWGITDEQAVRLGAAADEWGDMLYTAGVCEQPVPVPDDASAQDRLLARLGRDPGWTAD